MRWERPRDGGAWRYGPQLLEPKRTSVAARVPLPDRGLVSFIDFLLQPDPARRPTALQALQHPWLQVRGQAGARRGVAWRAQCTCTCTERVPRCVWCLFGPQHRYHSSS
jgi:hypothetical protein